MDAGRQQAGRSTRVSETQYVGFLKGRLLPPLFSFRSPKLWIFAAADATAITTLFSAARWLDHFLHDPYEQDFRLNYVVAKIGLTYGWSHIYDLDLERKLSSAFPPPGNVIDSMHNYVTPPPLAWLMTPFTLLSVPDGFLAWCIVSLIALVAAWWLVAPGRGLARVTLLLAALALWPIHYTFWLGQTATISILGLALVWWLLERERWAPAGAVLALTIFIKPQLVLLLPVAILVSGRWKPALYCGLASAIIGVASLISMGAHGIAEYRSDVAYTSTNLIHSVMTYRWFGSSTTATVIELSLGGVALGVAWYRRSRLDIVFALGIVGSTASASYLHEYDPAIFIVPAWILLGRGLSVPHRIWLLLGYLAADLIAIAIYKPMLVWEAGWIAMLGLEPWLVSRTSPNERSRRIAPSVESQISSTPVTPDSAMILNTSTSE